MAVFSMTGFATHQIGDVKTIVSGRDASHETQSTLGVEIRSVNSRFLDLAFKLPESLRSFEPTLREHLQKAFRRGKIEIRMWHDEVQPSVMTGHVLTRLTHLLDLQAQLQALSPQAQPLRTIDILRLSESNYAQSTVAIDDILRVTTRAIERLKEARSQEGVRLATLLGDHCVLLRNLVVMAAPLAKQAVTQHQERFLQRWQETIELGESMLGASINHTTKTEHVLSEAAAFAIKIDITEEVDRLNCHINEIELLLAKGGELGKRLDFLIQELHREANTLCSKAQSLELTRVGVDMKVVIEQMREQVQNIE